MTSTPDREIEIDAVYSITFGGWFYVVSMDGSDRKSFDYWPTKREAMEAAKREYQK